MSDDPLDFAIDLDDVRDRLRALNYFKSVTDIIDATEAIENVAALPPAAYVTVASETAEPNRLVGGHRQRVNARLSVLFVEQASRFDRSGKDALERTRKAVIRQLIGWRPRNALAPLEFDRYLLRATGSGLIWGETLFTASYTLSTG